MHAGGPAAAVLIALVACADPASTSSPTAPSTSSSPAPSSTASAPLASTAIPAPAPGIAPPLSPRRAALLAQEVAQRREEMLRANEMPAQMVTVGDVFVLGPGEPLAPIDAAISLAQQTVDALYAGPFLHRPDSAVVVWVYASEGAYRRGVAAHASPGSDASGIGLYDDNRRVILTWTNAAGIGSLAHEIAHPLVLADFPHAPAWLLEGLPALFEVPDFSHPGEIHGKAHFRLQTLRDVLASKNAALAASIRLDTLFDMIDDTSFRAAPVSLHYAMAREALRWLDSTGKLWPYYHAFRDNVPEDPHGVDAFMRVAGKSPAEATADWLAWIQSPAAERGAP